MRWRLTRKKKKENWCLFEYTRKHCPKINKKNRKLWKRNWKGVFFFYPLLACFPSSTFLLPPLQSFFTPFSLFQLILPLSSSSPSIAFFSLSFLTYIFPLALIFLLSSSPPFHIPHRRSVHEAKHVLDLPCAQFTSAKSFLGRQWKQANLMVELVLLSMQTKNASESYKATKV